MSRVSFSEDVPLATEKPKSGSNKLSSSQLACPNCGSRKIEQHDASGATICTECGIVVEENAIVSSVEFVEGAGGSSSMVGQFVSANSSKAYSGGAGGRRYAFSKDSRELTLGKARRRIQEVASRLRLGSHFVDSAHRLYTIALEKNFTQGRRSLHVVAACLYIACRQEKSQHMLIDYSDALQVNVYTLGTCFLKFRRLLGLQLEIIDPALYVYRFAAHLDLDEKATAVSMTALRLVARMKRDWIVVGRRPAGICAAALLIASRAHGFSKHHQDVTRILKVCGMTVNTRLREFENTASSKLTLEQFGNHELMREADPPCFTRNRIQEARLRAIQDGNTKLLESGALDDPMCPESRRSKWREAQKPSPEQAKLMEVYRAIENDLESGPKELGEAGKDASPDAVQVEAEQPQDDGGKSQVAGKEIVPEGEKSKLVVWKGKTPTRPGGRRMILSDQYTEEERQESTVPVEDMLCLEEWKEGMPDSIDKEIDDMFRSDEEQRQMEVIFDKMNRDYIQKQEQKEKERKLAEAENAEEDREDAAQAAGHARYKRRKRKDGTTEEQLMAVVAARKVSRKINYDALSEIFDDKGAFATNIPGDPGVEDNGGFDLM